MPFGITKRERGMTFKQGTETITNEKERAWIHLHEKVREMFHEGCRRDVTVHMLGDSERKRERECMRKSERK